MQDQTITVQYLTFEQFESQLTPYKQYFQFSWRIVKPTTNYNNVKGYDIEGDSIVDYFMTDTDVLLLLPAEKIAIINKEDLNLK